MTDMPEGVSLVLLDEVDSTNEEARRRAAAGEDCPIWIMARRQTSARGRRGRAWRAPEGNLSATLLTRPREQAATAALASFSAALAVSDVFHRFAPNVSNTLKWPNDALLNGAKAAGILLEGAGTSAMDWLCIGIGVNIAEAPSATEIEENAMPATSILQETGVSPDPLQVLEVLAASFAGWEKRRADLGFEPVRQAWLSRASRLGERIEARLPNETLRGVFEDVDGTGALILNNGRGRRAIAAADVHFP